MYVTFTGYIEENIKNYDSPISYLFNGINLYFGLSSEITFFRKNRQNVITTPLFRINAEPSFCSRDKEFIVL